MIFILTDESHIVYGDELSTRGPLNTGSILALDTLVAQVKLVLKLFTKHLKRVSEQTSLLWPKRQGRNT